MIVRAIAIAYNRQILEGFVVKHGSIIEEIIDIKNFTNQPEKYTINDVRNKSELKENKIFAKSLSFPMGELRDNIDKILTEKPIVLHCANGCKGAAGSSLINST